MLISRCLVLGALAAASAQGTGGVVIIITYFGHDWPPWLALTLRSMEANAATTFAFVTDLPRPRAARWPANARLHNVSMGALFARCRARLGVDGAGVSNPHRGGALSHAKTPDLKPLLGQLLPEVVAGFGFWGWSDADVLFGDLDRALAPLRRRERDAAAPPPCDVVSGYRNYLVSGPFALVRNAAALNLLFAQSPDWVRMLRSRRYMVFDEWWGAHMLGEKRSVVSFHDVLADATAPPPPGAAWPRAPVRACCAQLIVDDRAYRGARMNAIDGMAPDATRRLRWCAPRAAAAGVARPRLEVLAEERLPLRRDGSPAPACDAAVVVGPLAEDAAEPLPLPRDAALFHFIEWKGGKRDKGAGSEFLRSAAAVAKQIVAGLADECFLVNASGFFRQLPN